VATQEENGYRIGWPPKKTTTIELSSHQRLTTNKKIENNEITCLKDVQQTIVTNQKISINRNKKGIESNDYSILSSNKYNKRNTKVLESNGHPNPSTKKNKCEKNESIVLPSTRSILEHEICINYPNWI